MKITSVLAAVGIAATSLVVTQGVSNAACRADHACLYSHANFAGNKRQDFNSRPNWGDITYTGTSIALYRGDGAFLNVSSIENEDQDSYIGVYYNSQYRGPCFRIRPNRNIANFALIRMSDGRSPNDLMNSHRFNPPSSDSRCPIYG